MDRKNHHNKIVEELRKFNPEEDSNVFGKPDSNSELDSQLESKNSLPRLPSKKRSAPLWILLMPPPFSLVLLKLLNRRLRWYHYLLLMNVIPFVFIFFCVSVIIVPTLNNAKVAKIQRDKVVISNELAYQYDFKVNNGELDLSENMGLVTPDYNGDGELDYDRLAQMEEDGITKATARAQRYQLYKQLGKMFSFDPLSLYGINMIETSAELVVKDIYKEFNMTEKQNALCIGPFQISEQTKHLAHAFESQYSTRETSPKNNSVLSLEEGLAFTDVIKLQSSNPTHLLPNGGTAVQSINSITRNTTEATAWDPNNMPKTVTKIYNGATTINDIEWKVINEANYFPRADSGGPGRMQCVDVLTGRTFELARCGGYNHMDVEPWSMEDTKTLKEIYGNDWGKYVMRAVLIVYKDEIFAASLAGAPHAPELDKVSNNGVSGVLDLHFRGSTRHMTGTSSENTTDERHQKKVIDAKNATQYLAGNGEVPPSNGSSSGGSGQLLTGQHYIMPYSPHKNPTYSNPTEIAWSEGITLPDSSVYPVFYQRTYTPGTNKTHMGSGSDTQFRMRPNPFYLPDASYSQAYDIYWIKVALDKAVEDMANGGQGFLSSTYVDKDGNVNRSLQWSMEDVKHYQNSTPAQQFEVACAYYCDWYLGSLGNKGYFEGYRTLGPMIMAVQRYNDTKSASMHKKGTRRDLSIEICGRSGQGPIEKSSGTLLDKVGYFDIYKNIGSGNKGSKHYEGYTYYLLGVNAVYEIYEKDKEIYEKALVRNSKPSDSGNTGGSTGPNYPDGSDDANPPNVEAKPDTAKVYPPIYNWGKLGGQITSPFHEDRGYKHRGVDLWVPVNTPIHAIKGGTVITSRCHKPSDPGKNYPYPNKDYTYNTGDFVEILHDDGTKSRIMHMYCGSIRVKQGQRVNQGDIIGGVGNTGSTGGTTGIHLHFELWKDGVETDPTDIINKGKLWSP